MPAISGYISVSNKLFAQEAPGGRVAETYRSCNIPVGVSQRMDGAWQSKRPRS
jgi:hypothetical protein